MNKRKNHAPAFKAKVALAVTEDVANANPAPELVCPGTEEAQKGMSKNKLSDLNDHLFAQLERISNEGLSGDRLTEEINRAKAVTGVSREIISNASLLLRARQYAMSVNFSGDTHLPPMLEG